MENPTVRKIIHVDMDAFYASVEQRNNPSLRGKPVVVGGRPDGRGVVSTCSYEARVFGIHSAMPAAEAYRRCPQAIFITDADFNEYRRVSAQINGIFREISDKVEPLSLDEAYIDVTENKKGEKSATRLAQLVRSRILEETDLTASAGVSYNKSLAKIASDWKKPDGLTVITPEEAPSFLEELPVRKFWGVGPVTAERMEGLGIRIGADLRKKELWELIEAFGKSGPWYYDLCRGVDKREVTVERCRKSLGKERTFQEDISDVTGMIDFLESLCDTVWDELSQRELKGRTVTLKVKYSDFQQVTRSRSFLTALESSEQLSGTVRELLGETEVKFRAVRLLGASVSSFEGSSDYIEEAGQLALAFHNDSE